MAKKIVKCKYCGLQFDRNAEPFVEVGTRRYAHKACADKVQETIPQEEIDYQNLELYIKKLFNTNTLNAKTKKQIRDFRQEYNYSYTGMLKTLYWWYEIKGHTTELAKDGIGIVPFVYEDALNYYYSIYLAKLVNDTKQSYTPEIQEVEIESPRVWIEPKRLFTFEDEIGEESHE